MSMRAPVFYSTAALVQGELIASGFAGSAPLIGSSACAMEPLGRENATRQARLGPWANSYYAVLDAPASANGRADLRLRSGNENERNFVTAGVDLPSGGTD